MIDTPSIRWMSALLFAAVICGSCDDSAVGPVDDGLELSIDVSPRDIASGTIGSMSMQLRNLRDEEVTITFTSTCQLRPVVRSMDSDAGYPPDGSYGCGDMMTAITLMPHELKIVSLPVHGQHFQIATAATASVVQLGAGLPPGFYLAHVELEHNMNGVELRSKSVAFRVR